MQGEWHTQLMGILPEVTAPAPMINSVTQKSKGELDIILIKDRARIAEPVPAGLMRLLPRRGFGAAKIRNRLNPIRPTKEANCSH